MNTRVILERPVERSSTWQHSINTVYKVCVDN